MAQVLWHATPSTSRLTRELGLPRQVFSRLSQQPRRFLDTWNICFEEGSPYDGVYGVVTYNASLCSPANETVVILGADPFTTVACVRAAQVQAQPQAHRHPDCLVI